jgi:hypothetical protein
MSVSVEEWTSGMDARQLRACIARFEDEEKRLRARVAKLEAALEDIGKQMLMSEMGAEQAEYADYEGAYETMVKVARAVLKDAPQ